MFKKKVNPRIVLIVGHDHINKGALSCEGITEYDYWLKVLTPFKQMNNVFVLTRNHGGIKGAYTKAKEIGADFILEFHFNSFDGKTEGAEVLYNINNNLELAVIVHQSVIDFRNCKNRGVKKVTNGDRGFINLKGVRNAVIIEPFFGDNKKDYVKPELASEMVRHIVDAVRERFYK